MRGVIGGDTGQGPVTQTLDHSVEVVTGAQRRIHLIEPIIVGDVVVSQQQMVRSRLTGDIRAVLTAPTQSTNRLPGRGVAQMVVGTSFLGDHDVAGHLHSLGKTSHGR